MTTKTQLLLVPKSKVEEVVNALFAQENRAAALQAQGSKMAGDMFQRMMSQWEKLTQMQKIGDKAIIPIRGTVTPDDPFAAYYGETSLTAFQANLAEALADDSVKGIILQVFSPGGYVYGVEAAANAVYAARSQKRVIAYTDSLAASAAYWLISAADTIVLGAETAEVGSIGVYLAHFDYSEALKEAGIKVTEVTAGEYKGLGSPYVPLSEEDQKLLQSDVNHVYTRFVNTVARNRGMEPSEVLKSANGLTFYGSDAVKRGLADSINTFTEVLAMTTKTKEQLEQEAADEQAAKDKKAADEKAALEATVKEQAAKLAAFEAADKTAKEVAEKTAKEAVETEAKEVVKTNLGREATAEEVEMYAGMSAGGRTAYKAQLVESKASRDKIAKDAGLTTEVATSGRTEAATDGLLIKAAKAVGIELITAP